MLDPSSAPRLGLTESARVVSFGLMVLIWLVQIIIYPAFADIAPDRFADWHARYTRAITWIVGPLMLAQAGLVVALAAQKARLPILLAAGLVALAWIATAALAVPIHNGLQAAGHDPSAIARLVRVNRVRTGAWTAAFLLLLL